MPLIRLLCFTIALALAAAAAPPGRAATPPEGARDWAEVQRLIAAGDLAAALPRLRDLAARHPGEARLQGELAFLQARLGQRMSARRSLAGIAPGAQIPPGLGPALAALEAQLQPPTGWRTSLRAGLVPQSNAGRQTSAERVTIGGLDFRLDERPRPGLGLDFALGAERLVEGRDWSRLLEIGLSGRLYEKRRWNDWSLAVSGGLGRDLGAGQLQFGLSARLRFIANRRHAQELSPYLALTHPLAPGWRGDLRLGATARRLPEARRQDARLWSLSLGLGWRLAERTELRLRLTGQRGRSAAAEVITAEDSLQIGVGHVFANGLALEASLRQTWARGRGRVALFGQPRIERETALQLRASPRGLEIWGLSPVFGLTLERRRANIPIYGWQNAQLELFWTKRF